MYRNFNNPSSTLICTNLAPLWVVYLGNFTISAYWIDKAWRGDIRLIVGKSWVTSEHVLPADERANFAWLIEAWFCWCILRFSIDLGRCSAIKPTLLGEWFQNDNDRLWAVSKDSKRMSYWNKENMPWYYCLILGKFFLMAEFVGKPIRKGHVVDNFVMSIDVR